MLAHNSSEFTARCLDSILQSTPLPKALVAVNNGSTDNTAEMLAPPPSPGLQPLGNPA